MGDLRQELEGWLRGRVCFVGVGNADRGDDGVGVRLAEALRARLGAEVIVAGEAPERHLPGLAGGGYDTVVFIDAVDFGGTPGSVVALDGAEIVARFPQVSTHKISLGVLARLIEASGGTRVRLLGVQPESIKAASGLSPCVRRTLDLLEELFAGAMAGMDAMGVPS